MTATGWIPGPPCPSSLLLLFILDAQGLLYIVDQQRRDSRLDQSVALLIRVDTVSQHGCREASVTVRDDYRRFRAIQTSSPGRNGIVNGNNGVVIEGQGNDLVNLSRV